MGDGRPAAAPNAGAGRRGTNAAAAAFVAVLAAVTSGAAVDRNTHRLATIYGNGPTVSIAEEQAFAWLADRVRPEERVVTTSPTAECGCTPSPTSAP